MMSDLLLLILAAWLALWLVRETGHASTRRGAGLRWARRRAAAPPLTHWLPTQRRPRSPVPEHPSLRTAREPNALHPGG